MPTKLNMTVRDAYLGGRERLTASGMAEPAIEAEVLLRHALAVDRTTLYTRWEATISEGAWQRYRQLLDLRTSGRPMHYIVGAREFMGLMFTVDERVMIPRPETELLVEYVVQVYRDQAEAILVDVGTGSGCIAISLARFLPDATVYAVDISAAALQVARANAHRHGVADRVCFIEGDLLAQFPVHLAGRINAIVSNPPYVPRAQGATLPREIRDYEPAVAILAPGDGLELHRRLIGGSPPWLRNSASLAMEVGPGQAQEVAAAMHRDGRYGGVRTLKDGGGADRVVVGTIDRPEGRSAPGRKM